MTKNVLVVAAHSDDEALGCGGTLARHAADGDQVSALFMTDGVGARGSDDQAGQERNQACNKAAEILGIKNIHTRDFPDNRMDSIDLLDIVQAVESVVNAEQPDVIYTHHGGDLNIDHQLTYRAVMTACRPQPGFPVREILCFETVSSTEWTADPMIFTPSLFVDITNTLDQKISALKAYEAEMRPFPHTRSYEAVEALARSRGTSIGVPAAEAFSVARILR